MEKQASLNIPKQVHPAYCGFDCAECPMYQATVTDDKELKAALIKKYSTPGRILTEADIQCRGCKSEKRYVHAFCEECAIRLCSMRSGIKLNCGECAEYPCDEISKRIPAGGKSRAAMDCVHSITKKS